MQQLQTLFVVDPTVGFELDNNRLLQLIQQVGLGENLLDLQIYFQFILRILRAGDFGIYNCCLVEIQRIFTLLDF